MMLTGGDANHLKRYRPAMGNPLKKVKILVPEDEVPDEWEEKEWWVMDVSSFTPDRRPEDHVKYCNTFVRQGSLPKYLQADEKELKRYDKHCRLVLSPHLTVQFVLYAIVKLMGKTQEDLTDQGRNNGCMTWARGYANLIPPDACLMSPLFFLMCPGAGGEVRGLLKLHQQCLEMEERARVQREELLRQREEAARFLRETQV